MFRTEEPLLKPRDKLRIFLCVHWKGIVCVVVPIICIAVLTPFPPEHYQWTAYCLIVMAVFWVTECIPLPVTSFLPLIVFPLTGVMSSVEVCSCFMNDSVFMFIGSLILASSVEQSGLHKRMAFIAIRSIGYSHVRLLVAIVVVTSFVSMWITNTAATTMMVPIIFAVLKIFEDQKLLRIYDVTNDGNRVASDITTCYFCTATFAATIGGVGTLIGTATNLVFKGLFVTTYPNAPEYLSFPLFSAFGFPYMIVLDICLILYILIVYIGCLRPRSDAAKRANIPPEGIRAAQAAVSRDYHALGPISFWELMVIILFGGAIIAFFCRSPQIFVGWGDAINNYFDLNDEKFVRDSALVGLVTILMLLLPSNLSFFNNCKAKFHEQLPKERVPSVLNWKNLMAELPFSFIFLLGGGFTLAFAARKSGLNDKIGQSLQGLKVLPNKLVLLLIIIVVTMITNLASNIAVANVFTPISMQLAKEISRNPLWYALASGFSASYCFMLPVGTPGNLIVQSAAKIPTPKMKCLVNRPLSAEYGEWSCLLLNSIIFFVTYTYVADFCQLFHKFKSTSNLLCLIGEADVISIRSRDIKAGLGPTISTILITWLAIYFYAPIVWPILEEPSPAWIS